MKTQTVFMVQQHLIPNHCGQLVPKFNTRGTEQFGQLETLLQPNLTGLDAEHALSVLKEKLKNYSDNDYILPLGTSMLIGLAVAVAADVNKGRVKLLQYNNRAGAYYIVSANVKLSSKERK